MLAEYLLYVNHAGKLKMDVAHTMRSRNEMAMLEDEGSIDPSYRCGYKGLVRLHKIKNSTEFDNYLSRQTAEHLVNGGKIEPLNEVLFVPLRSLRELLLGVSLVANASNNSASISVDDIRFIRQEFYEFMRAYAPSDQDFVFKKTNDSQEGHYFKKCGDYYEVNYKGKKVILKDNLGERYVEYLIKNPKKNHFCLDLVQVLNPADRSVFDQNQVESSQIGGEDVFSVSRDGMSDDDALKSYRDRLQLLKDLISDSEEIRDIESVEKYQCEMDFLLKEISASTDVHGKPRKFSSAPENARKAVSRAIKRALSPLKASHPELFEHFGTYLKIGNFCVYERPKNVIWQ